MKMTIIHRIELEQEEAEKLTEEMGELIGEKTPYMMKFHDELVKLWMLED